MSRSLEINSTTNKLRKGDRKMIKLNNKKGFTLIELMIVIAIIGILAAIAIPNFIAYRNKSYCKGAETDANNMAAAVADYFSIASHTRTPTIAQLNNNRGFTFTAPNSGTLVGDDPNVLITITVTEGTGRCPTEYQQKTPGWAANVYTKTIE
jgi:type IV pilus assembly protein PilA